MTTPEELTLSDLADLAAFALPLHDAGVPKVQMDGAHAVSLITLAAKAHEQAALIASHARRIEELEKGLTVEREIVENLVWAGEQNNKTIARLRWELGLAVANMEAAASAYRTYAKRHSSITPKATTDAAFTTRVVDFDKAAERMRATLKGETS